MLQPPPPSAPPLAPTPALALRFALRFVRGAAEVRTQGERLGDVTIDALSLGIDGVRFPVDMSRGAQGFRRHRTTLKTLSLSLEAAAIEAFAERLDGAAAGLTDLRLACRDGFVALSGAIAASPHSVVTPFSLRLAPSLMTDAPAALTLLAYDVRMFGAAAISERILVTLVQRVLVRRLGAASRPLDPWRTEVRIARAFSHYALPRFGWRPCKHDGVVLRELRCTREGLSVAFEPATATSEAPRMPARAAACVAQAEALRVLQPALAAWRDGDDAGAAASLAQAITGAPDAVLPVRTRRVAARWLASEASVAGEGPSYAALSELTPNGDWSRLLPGDVDDDDAAAHVLALRLVRVAALASWPTGLLAESAGSTPGRGESPREAAAAALGRLANEADAAGLSRGPPQEAGLALWGAAALLADEAPSAARQRLAAATQVGLTAAGMHALSFGLARAHGSVSEAMAAAMRWLAAVATDAERVAVHVARAEVWLSSGTSGAHEAQDALADAFALAPGDTAANALAAICVARSGRADGQAQAREAARTLEQQGDRAARPAQRAQAYWHAARVWRDGLGDAAQAGRLLQRGLGACAEHVPSLLLMASLAEARDAHDEASRLLQGAIAAAMRLPRGSAHLLTQPQQLDVHLRLVEHAVRQFGPGGWRDGSAGERAAHHLSHALRLSPTRDDLRGRLESLLEALQAHEPLAQLWLRTGLLAEARGDHGEARRKVLRAAALFAGDAQQPAEAVRLLLGLLHRVPADADALAMLLPLLSTRRDTARAVAVLQAAADAEGDCILRGDRLAQLARRLLSSDAPLNDKREAIERALSVLPQHLEMATARVDLLEAHTERGDAAQDEALALAYEGFAGALAAAPLRGRARIRAARALSWAGHADAALAAVRAALQEAPGDVDGWLLSLQLAEQKGASPDALVRELDVALTACASAAGVHKLWQWRAQLAQTLQSPADERTAWERAITTGGANEQHCERLLAVLEQAGDTQAQAMWLLRWAEAGWPLPVAHSSLRAAKLLLPDDVDGARRALVAAVHAGGDVLWQAASLLLELAEAHDWREELALGLEGQLRAVDEGLIAHADVPALEIRLMWAHQARGAGVEAESTCAGILASDPHNTSCHLFLADRLLLRRAWDEALDHYVAALLGPGQQPLDAPTRAQAADIAVPLAASLRPALLTSLRERGALTPTQLAASQSLTPQAAPLALADQLRARGQAALERDFLQHALLLMAAGEGRAALRLRLASCATDGREQALQAEAWLRQNLLENPRDVASRHALVPVLETLGNTRELAELHFALSQLVEGAERALHHVLCSAQACAARSDGRSMASDILLSFARRKDVPKAFPALWSGMRQAGFGRELAQWLESSLEASPEAGDGRLAELLDVLCEERKDAARAALWCQRFEAFAPADDVPWSLHIEVLLGRARPVPEDALAQADAVYRQWADSRSGEARAAILDALATQWRQVGATPRALLATEAALAVPDADAERTLVRLGTLIEGQLSRRAYAAAVPLLERQIAALGARPEGDPARRTLADVLGSHLSQPARALTVRLTMAAPHADDAMAAWSMALQTEAAATLLTRPALVGLLPAPARGPLLSALWSAQALAEAQRALSIWLQGDDASERHNARDAAATAADAQAVWDALPSPSDTVLRAIWSWLAAEALMAAAPALAKQLRLLGLAGIAEGIASAGALPPIADRAQQQLEDRAYIGDVLSATDWADARQARSAFVLARRCGDTEVARRAASRLLAEGDSRDAADVLATLVEADLQDGHLERAIERLRKLEALGDARCAELFDATLRKAGRIDELLARLSHAVDGAAPAQRSAALVALCREQLSCGRIDQAAASLSRVLPEDRDEAVARTEWDLAAAQHDPARQAAAAGAVAACVQPADEVARWLRREAHVRWWQLEQVSAAHALLRRAERHAPLSRAAVLRDIDGMAAGEATRALHEALVVSPHAAQAPLWARLAANCADPAGGADALRQALVSLAAAARVGDADTSTATQLVALARTYDDPALLTDALMAAARAATQTGDDVLAGAHWCEAARVAPAAQAGVPLIEAARARLRADAAEDVPALLTAALRLSAPPDALWPLVWQHLAPEDDRHAERRRAAWHLARDGQLEATVAAPKQALAWLMAAEHGVGERDAPITDVRRCLAAAQSLLRDAPDAQAAALWRRAFGLGERLAEGEGDVRALIGLWRNAPRVPTLPDDVRVCRVRRAAYLAGGLAHNERTAELWHALLALQPTDDEAQLQVWLAEARRIAARATGEADAVPALVDALLTSMETRLAALPLGPARAALTLLGAQACTRIGPMAPDANIRLLGRAYQAAAAVVGDDAAAAPPAWSYVRDVGDALAGALEHARRPHDALAVTGRVALLAPQAERPHWLSRAGARAQAVGDLQQAFQFYWPVAEADADSAAWRFCLQICESQQMPREAVALLTAEASRAAPARAARALAQAAQWAAQMADGAPESLRLYEASFRLHQDGKVLAALLEAYVRVPDAAAHEAAAMAFDPSLLAGVDADNGATLACHIAELLLSHVPVPAAAGRRMLAMLSDAAMHTARSRPLRLQLARAIGEPAELLEALWQHAQHVSRDDAATSWPLYAEAAAIALTLGRVAQARTAALRSLTDPHAPPSWGWQAWQAWQARTPGGSGDSQDDVAFEAALMRALQRLLPEWQRFAAPPSATPNDYPPGWADEQIAIWHLLAARAHARNDGAAEAGALEQLAAWLAPRQDPAWLRATVRLADAMGAQGAPAEAAAVLAKVAGCAQLGVDERALAHLRIAALADRTLHDTPRQQAHLDAARALSAQADSARPAIALALWSAGRHREARALVSAADHADVSALPTDLLVAWLACAQGPSVRFAARAAVDDGRAAAVVATLRARGADGALCQLLLGARAEAEHDPQAALTAYARGADALTADGLQEPLEAQLWLAWADLLQLQGQPLQALDVLQRGLQVHDGHPEMVPLLQAACESAERAEMWPRAAAFARALAGQADDPIVQLGAAQRAAHIERTHVGDWQAAARDLWEATARHAARAAAPPPALREALAEVWQALWDLLDGVAAYLPADGPWSARRMQAAEQVLSQTPAERLGAERGLRLAAALAQQEPARALLLLRQVDAKDGVPEHMVGLWQDVAWRAQDWPQFIALAEAEEARAEALGERDAARGLSRQVALAEAHARDQRSLEAARPWLLRALEQLDGPLAPARSQMPETVRRIADLVAGLPDLRDEAMRLYADVLRHAPMDTDALRMAARVAGQEGDIERAWGLYACLLWLLPTDAEAGRFVVACRARGGDEEHVETPRGRGRPLVKKVQQALDEVARSGLLRDEERPSRAYDVAQLLRADIDLVLGEMVSAPFGEPRSHALTAVPEAYQLFRFAQSPAFFAVRERLNSNRDAALAAPRTARAAGGD